MATTRLSSVTGLTEALDILRKFPDRIQKKVLASAVRSGATVIRKAARSAAPIGSKPSRISKKYGPLRDNIRVIKLKRDVPIGSAMYRVDTGNSPQGYWIEFGTMNISAKPWFRPAIDAAGDAAVDKIRERIAAGLEREAIKLSRGAGR